MGGGCGRTLNRTVVVLKVLNLGEIGLGDPTLNRTVEVLKELRCREGRELRRALNRTAEVLKASGSGFAFTSFACL